MNLIEAISQHIAVVTDSDFTCVSEHSAGGGCINTAFRLNDVQDSYFVKINTIDRLFMFEAEAQGLQAMADTKTIKVPEPVCTGVACDKSYIVMENIEFGNRGSAGRLGEQLAAMHCHTEDQFGFHIDNTIGSTPQINTPGDSWIKFWQQHRLGYQLLLARNKGLSAGLYDRGMALVEKVPAFFEGYTPQPSLLHGDLWRGNYAYTKNSAPVIYDPATYYGDCEADIAMTELFGGFGHDFYAAYRHIRPLDQGYNIRKVLYNLYHILNHANLFGGGYANQAIGMIDRLLAEAG